DPHVRDDAGPLEVREDGRLARDRTLAVVVRVPVLVIGGGAKRFEILGLGQAERVGKARIDALRSRGERPQQRGSGQGGEDSGVLHGLSFFGLTAGRAAARSSSGSRSTGTGSPSG